MINLLRIVSAMICLFLISCSSPTVSPVVSSDVGSDVKGNKDIGFTDVGESDLSLQNDIGIDSSCISDAAFVCDAGDVYWQNACGEIEALTESCSELGCEDGTCLVDPSSILELSNFEIRDTEPGRLYFKSSVPFTGSTVIGFSIPDDLSSNTPSNESHFSNLLTSVFINAGKTKDHYFVLAHDYIYGDNILIKYQGGGDFSHLGGAPLHIMTHRKVENLLSEPGYGGTIYYVDRATGDNNDSGKTEDLAFRTITKGALVAKAGDVVYIRSGNYGDEKIVFANSGTKNNRIKFSGYKDTPGDNPVLNWEYGKQGLDPQIMPLVDGGDRDSGIAFDFFKNENQYITLENIQVRNYATGVKGKNNRYLHLKNIIVVDLGLHGYSGFGFTLIGIAYNNTLEKCIVENATAVGFRIYGYFNALIDSKVFCDEFEGDAGGDDEPTDYYSTFRGDWNLINNVHLEKVGDLEHGGHGITFKGDRDLGNEIGSVANNLAENSTIIHINGSVELRHRMVQWNTIRNIDVLGNPAFPTGRTGGFDLRDGASNNVIEGSTVSGVKNGITFFDSNEDQRGQFIARDNIIRNNVFKDIKGTIIRMDTYRAATDDLTGNQILYNTFVDGPTLFGGLPKGEVKDNLFLGNIVYKIDKMGNGADVFEKTNSNYFAGFIMDETRGNISVDPKFMNDENDFRLKSGSECVDAGPETLNIWNDFNGVHRPIGEAHDLGAFESH